LATEYVMVPVPEEHLEEVMNFVRWHTVKPPAVTFDEQAVAWAIRGVDDMSRTLLGAAAAAALEGRDVTASDLGRASSCSYREVVGAILEINQLLLKAGGLQATLMMRPAPGERDLSERVVSMPEPLARIVAGPATGINPVEDQSDAGREASS
jgi:hypothetical protein